MEIGKVFGTGRTLSRVAGGVVLALSFSARSPARAQDQQAQQPAATAAVVGVVTAAQTGEPLMGIQVVIRGSRRWAITNQDGAFRLDGLKPGSYTLEFRHPNRAPIVHNLTLEPDQTTELAVRVDTRTVALPEIVVEGKETQPAAKMAEFNSRKAAGHGGYFVTRKDIEERQPRVLSDMLRRVPGLRVDCDFGSCRVTSFSETRRIMGACPIQYFLDGIPFLGDVDEMTPDQIEGIEIYRGSSSIPPQFNTGTSMCGVIGIWSRVPG
ncbi:MAG: carboxypeptidase regulatory-like domain-containing protein [Gemmatimonadetes bacterium]|nr:carboxypeptidase regulatory-like domain-containing protein [Gemmatimonadota bacterium]